jgi:PKD repeat protein
MKKIYLLLMIFSSIALELNAQAIINEGFESGSFSPFISFQTTGTYTSAPGIINNTNFGSAKAFSFGRSTCGSSCFNNYVTTLIITFPAPTYVDSIKWKEMEISGNWGSQGQVLLDDVVFAGATLGAMPVNSGVPDATPQLKNFSINQMVTTIKFKVSDITNASEIILDDLQITYTPTPLIAGYEYWFNNDFANKTRTSVTQTQQLLINELIPTTGLTNGINTFNFRSFDNLGMYSSVLSHFFYKPSALQNNTNPEIVAYEYWLDNDYVNAVVVNTPAQQLVNINELIAMTSLNNGVHQFNIRFKDNMGLWSSVVSHFFYKPSALQNNTNPEIVAYEYWLDNDYVNAVVVNTPAQQLVNINELIAMTSLNNGVHQFNIRFKDNMGLWSSVVSNFFYKVPEQIVAQNTITEYRYWFDNDFANAANISLTPNQQINLIDNLDLTQIPKGDHEINFQFKDTLGLWSVVLTDTIKKLALPIADFSYSAMQYCDSTVVAFTDNSIDGDVYLWDFADGTTDTLANPTHTFYNSGLHSVSLTVRDTITFANSTKQVDILITGHTEHSFSVTSCDSYTSPSGNYTYTTSGVYYDTIPNQWGCDSLLTIDLTINHSNSGTDVITACDSYTWIDGNTYTESNNSATFTLTNSAGCDSIVTLNLTINHSNSGTDVITACNSYTWIDGNTYTESNNSATFTLTNSAGCDSIVTLNLTINHSNSGTDVITACDSYTWIDGNTYTESNNTAYYTIPGGAANGCDSTVYLNLTINTVDVTVTQNEESLTANALNATYQWLNCDEGFAPLSGETGQTFTPTQNGNYAVKVTQNGCTDTSSCYNVIANLVENSFATTIKVFPNPTSGNVVVDLGGVYPTISVSITDQSGRSIRNIRGENVDSIEIYLNEPKGIYLLTIQDGKQRATVRIVKY